MVQGEKGACDKPFYQLIKTNPSSILLEAC